MVHVAAAREGIQGSSASSASLSQWRNMIAVTGIVFVGIAAHATSSLKSLIVQSFIHGVGLNPAISGYLLANEMVSTSAGTALATAFPVLLGRRLHLFVALATMMVANLLSIPLSGGPSVELFVLRALCGLGAGFGLGRLAILIALLPRPTRTAGIYSVSTQVYGAIAAFCMPFLYQWIGSTAIFVVLAATVPPALAFVAWLPDASNHEFTPDVKSTTRQPTLARLDKILIAGSFLIFYTGVGLFLPFVSVFGESTKLSVAHVSMALGWAGIASALGSAAAIFAGDHKSSAPIIAFMFAIHSASVGVQLVFPTSQWIFICSLISFSFTYMAIIPMILGAMSRLDDTGQMNGLFFILAIAGIALGPSIAGWILHSYQVSGVALLRSLSLALLVSASAVQVHYAYRAANLRQRC